MTRTIAMLTTAAALTLGGVANAQTTSEGYDMLQTAIMNDFAAMDIPMESTDNLTLGQISAIKGILDSEGSQGSKKSQIEAIIANN